MGGVPTTYSRKERTSESLTFQALPRPHKCKKWFSQRRDGVIQCCRDPDKGWTWQNEIRDKSFEELKDQGEDEFERADLLAAGVFIKIYSGELETILLTRQLNAN